MVGQIMGLILQCKSEGLYAQGSHLGKGWVQETELGLRRWEMRTGANLAFVLQSESNRV